MSCSRPTSPPFERSQSSSAPSGALAPHAAAPRAHAAAAIAASARLKAAARGRLAPARVVCPLMASLRARLGLLRAADSQIGGCDAWRSLTGEWHRCCDCLADDEFVCKVHRQRLRPFDRKTTNRLVSRSPGYR